MQMFTRVGSDLKNALSLVRVIVQLLDRKDLKPDYVVLTLPEKDSQRSLFNQL